MKTKRRRKTEKGYIIAGLIILVLGLIPCIFAVLFPPEGVGIIGGADAPTALFLIGHTGKKQLLFIAAGLILLLRGISGITKSSS